MLQSEPPASPGRLTPKFDSSWVSDSGEVEEGKAKELRKHSDTKI